MIGRSNRFHGRSSLKRHYDRSKTVRCSTIALKFALSQQRSGGRIAVVVSKKVSKSAVVRNRIRRRLYERVRILFTSFTVPMDLVFVVYDESVAVLPAAELDREVAKLCQKAALGVSRGAEHAIVESKE